MPTVSRLHECTQPPPRPADAWGMNENDKIDPALADTQPSTPDDEGRDPVRDLALLLRAALVLRGELPVPGEVGGGSHVE